MSAATLVAADMKRGHRGRRALVDVGRPHVERRRRDLEREPDEDHREPADEEELVRLARGRGDLDEAELAGGAVDEGRAEEQDRRAEAPHDQVLEPRLERRDPVDADRDEDVERDREPLEPEEEREQRVRLEEEAHSGDGGEEQRVVLDHALAVIGHGAGASSLGARLSQYETPTARSPATETKICPTSAKRSRTSEPFTSVSGTSSIAEEDARHDAGRDEASPRRTTAPNTRRQARGRKTPTTSTTNDPPSRMRIGTSAAQSMSGLTNI